MATVADMIMVMDSFLGDSRGAAGDDAKIQLLDVAKNEIWRVILANDPEGNWFTAFSQSVTPGNVDYFAKLVSGTSVYAFPPNFHQLRRLECITPSREHVRLVKTNIARPDWQSAHEVGSSAEEGTHLMYDLMGPAPGSLVMPRAPSETLDFKLYYVYSPTAWTAKTDTVDDFPFALHNLIADWAASRLILGIGDRRYAAFNAAWENRVKQWIRVSRRDETGPTFAQGFLEEPHESGFSQH